MKKIGIIDGQGGGIGSAIIKSVKEVFGEEVEIVALGTNAIATANMLKSRANRGASGENAIIQTVKQLDIIMGPISILMANAMMGEVTPAMAEAICSARAEKMLIPLSQENIWIAGVSQMPLPHLIDELVLNHLKYKVK